MYLSRDWTVLKLWREAAQDLDGAMKLPHYVWKDLVNRTVQAISGQFYDLMVTAYMTDTYINDSSGSKYQTTSGGFYIASSHTLGTLYMSESLTSADVDKWVVYRIGTSVYSGKIFSVPTSGTLVVVSDEYPPADGVLAEMLICGTIPSNDTISLSGLRIMRTGMQGRIEISTTATATVKTATQIELDTFRTTGQNSKTIVWSLNGDNINLKKGDGLTSYGTPMIRYPRIPYLSLLDSDGIDLPDGAAIEIAISYLRNLIQRRLKIPPENPDGLYQQQIINLHNQFGKELTIEEAKDKEKALALN